MLVLAKAGIDTADGDIPVSCLLTSASLHDSQAAIPLATITASRVTNLYDLMDSASDAPEIREKSRALGHVPERNGFVTWAQSALHHCEGIAPWQSRRQQALRQFLDRRSRQGGLAMTRTIAANKDAECKRSVYRRTDIGAEA